MSVRFFKSVGNFGQKKKKHQEFGDKTNREMKGYSSFSSPLDAFSQITSAVQRSTTLLAALLEIAVNFQYVGIL